jgi:hypothetical protein
MTVRVFRPDGAVAPLGHHISPPRRVLAGARIGVLDNGKPNAGLLMTYVADRLAERTGSPPPLVLLKNAAHPAPDDVLDRLRTEVDVVLTGSAD